MNKDKNYIFECLEKQQSIQGADFEFAGYVDFEKRPYKYIVFENCVFNDKVIFTNVENILGFYIINCRFNSVLILEDFKKINVIEFNNSQFRYLYLDESESDTIKITECNISNLIELNNLKIRDFKIEIININVEGEISIDSNDIDVLQIKSANESTYHSVVLNDFKFIQINANVNDLKLNAKKFDRLEVVNYSEQINSINNFIINDLVFDGNIYFNSINVDIFTLSHVFSSIGVLKLNEVEIRITQINNCYIDNLIFNQVKFIEPPNIQTSDLSKFKMINVSWADKSKSLESSFINQKIPVFYQWRKKYLKKWNKVFSKDQISLLKYQIETYRQLKIASQNNHNQIDALAFYRNEMRLYWKEIRLVGGEKWYNTVLIFLNRIISDFGQNWVSPLLFLFGVHFILFMCIYKWQFSCNLTDVEYGVGQYFRLLNPVRVTPDYINSGMGIFTDFWMRVLNGFFIYHFLKASRKYGKGE